MAMTDKRRGRWWSRLHFGVRFIGLTGLLLVAVGLALAILDSVLTLELLRLNWDLLRESAGQLTRGEAVGQWPHFGLLLLGAGLVAGLFALLVEIVVVTRMVAGRRSALGLNAAAQVVLATILLVGVNLWSAGCDIDLSSIGLGRLHSAPHFARLDITRSGDFTLPPELLDDLRQLEGETTIIVYDRNRPFGKSPERQDAKDQAIQNAAERVVVDKLKDLMEQFREQGVRYRELGARFKVEVLDVDDENIEERLAALTGSLAESEFKADRERRSTDLRAELRRLKGEPDKLLPRCLELARNLSSGSPPQEDLDRRARSLQQEIEKVWDRESDLAALCDRLAARLTAAELRRTIEDVPENSIFVVSGGRVQRLSFNDFYYLDKQASRQQDNLVLLYQGAEPLARKIMNVDEKKPVVGVLVIHEVLSTESNTGELSMAAVRRALEGRGFTVRDIILKNWAAPGEPEPAVYTYDESRYERLQEQLTAVEEDIRDLTKVLEQLNGLVKQWKESSLAELTQAYKDQLAGRQVTEAMRKLQLEVLERNLAIQEYALNESKQEREAVTKQMAGLSVDRLAEQRRISDLKYKLDRELAECDLIIVPRISLINVNLSYAVPYDVHLLQDAQVDAIKDYLKQGKPALFTFGPSSEAPSQFRPPARSSDGLDDLLAQLGFELNRQTVMYDVERKSFAELRAGLVVMGSTVEVPPLEFDSPAGAALLGDSLPERTDKPINPVRKAMQIAGSSLGQQGLRIQARHPRPIGFDAARLKTLPFDPVFMVTPPSTWSENNPFPGREIPRFNPPDDKKADLVPERRGPFAVGLAVEEPVPQSWYGSEQTRPAIVRVAVLGHGHLFVEDNPDQALAKDTMLLTLSNWLLGRDDLLPTNSHPWTYPRVALNWSAADADPETVRQESDRWLNVWRILAFGLPFVFVYAGAVVYLMRRVR